MTYIDEFKKKHPFRYRWETFKIAITEVIAKYLNIHLDW